MSAAVLDAKSDTTFIYALYDPRGGSARYVGKADQPEHRLRQHAKETRMASKRGSHTHRTAWLQGLADAGVEPEMRVIDEVPNSLWQIAEKAWIRDLISVGCDLVNGTEGGDGFVGRKHSEETKRKMSAAQKGKTLSAEHREKLRVAHTGKKMSEDMRAKRRAHMAGTKPSQAMLDAAAAATRGVPRPPEVRLKISEGHAARRLREAESESNVARGRGLRADAAE